MSKQKKQHGGDWIDKLQAHNRNVYLERQAEQAKLDRQQNEEHRRQLREIEQKKRTMRPPVCNLPVKSEPSRIARSMKMKESTISRGDSRNLRMQRPWERGFC